MPINSSLIAELKQEGANSRKMIERVPLKVLNENADQDFKLS